MTPELLTALMVICLFIGIFSGFPIVFVLGGEAIIFGILGWGPEALYTFIHRIYALMDNFVLVAGPLFIFMANLLGYSGIAERLFEGFRLLFGPLKGGLAVAVVAVATIFAACTGIIGASVVSMGILAIPIMLKYGYQKELTTGTVAAGGSLGILIPPSVMLVICADQAGLSVGKLYAAAVVPGILLAVLYTLYILLRCHFNPELGPPMSKEELSQIPISQRLYMSLVNLVPPLVLILGVLGSMFAGIATATEAAAVGAFLSFLMILAYKRFSWKSLVVAVQQTAKTTSMSLWILCGGTCFTAVFLGIGGGEVVTDVFVKLGMGKWGTFGLMMVILLILGCLIDWIAIVLITFPVFLPVAKIMGFDPVWFVTMICINLQASFLTPPFGYALFYLKAIVPEGVNMGHITRGAISFVGMIVISLIICSFFPQIILWLPSILVN